MAFNKNKKIVTTALTAAMVASAVAPVAAATKAVTPVQAATKAVDAYYKLSVKTKADVQNSAKVKKVALTAIAKLGKKDAKVKASLTAKVAKKSAAINKYYQTVIVAAENEAKAIAAVEAFIKLASSTPVTAETTKEQVEQAYAQALALIAKVKTEAKKTEFKAAADKMKADALAKIEELATPKVASVTAINAKQLVVTFNKELQAGLATGGAEVVTNYTLGSANPSRVTLNEDKKSVTLTFAAGFVADLNKYVEFKVENVKDAKGVAVPKYQAPLYLEDKVVPAASVSFSAPVASVKFSEPVNLASATVSLDGVAKTAGADFTVTEDSVDALKGAVKLAFSGLATGTHNIAIVGAKDLAGNFLPDTVLTVTVGSDNVAPEVTSVVAEGSNVRVTFSESVDQAVLKDGVTTVGTVLKAASVDGAGKEFVIDASALITGSNTFVTKELTVAAGSADASGNTSKELKKTLTLTLDKVAPKVTSTTIKSDKIIVKLDEAIVAGDTPIAASVDYDFTTADGIVKPTAALALDGVAYVYDANNDGDTTDAGENQYLVLDASAALAAGKYKVSVPEKAIKDTKGNNIGATTLTFEVSPTSNVLETLNATPTQVSPGVLQFVFSAEVTDAALNPNNFTINGATVPAGSKIYFYGDKTTVRVELPEGFVAVDGSRTVAVKDIKDKNGNLLTTAAKNGSLVVLKENIKIAATKVTLTSSKTLEVSFSEAIKAGLTLSGIEVKKNGVVIPTADVAITYTGSTVTLTTTSASFDLADTITVGFVSSNVQDANGNTIKDVVVSK
ncbi:Ig-like domain-containing protein [Gottfriedia sp. OAE603]|uniref:Ig-like domain-containing protein n=1 Tax=Gottfriedia sp. OAE603 TaxID=2663872 RepID=UPI00178B50E5